MTNFERITASPETLATWITSDGFNCESLCPQHDPMAKYMDLKCDELCEKHCLDWLNSEAEQNKGE